MKLSKWLLTITMLVCSAMVWAKVNINTASLSELETLNGIGAKKAEKIIEYREKVGGFKSVDDLINVQGIGSVTLDKIRNDIEVIGTSVDSKKTTAKPAEKKEADKAKEVKETSKSKTSQEHEKSSNVTKETKEEKSKENKAPSQSSSNKEEKDKSTSTK